MRHQILMLPRFLLAIMLVASGTLANAQTQAMLESPAPGAFVQSGVGLIRGWACEAQQIEISIDGGPRQAIAYGTERLDTQPVCGDSNNGFGFTQNWNRVSNGVHNLRALIDGVEFANVNFTVTTLGREFLTGLRAQYTLQDFPSAGVSPQVLWSETHQNFVFTRQVTIPANTPPPDNPRMKLESPSQGSHESGIGLIRGWACEAQQIEISIDGGPRQAIAYGTERLDTQPMCGDSNNGFGFTQNWNRVSDGVHNLRAYRDEVEFANVNFAVTTLGREEFLTGLSSQFKFGNFPETGQTTTAKWSQPQQNFIVTRTTLTSASRLALITAITDAFNPMAVAGNGTTEAGTAGESTGVRAAKRGDGLPTQLEGITWANRQTGQSADLSLAADGLPAAYTDSSGMEARFSDYQLTDAASSVTVSFFRNGTAQGNPTTVPIEGARLRALQTMAERVRQAVQNAPASTGRQVTPEVSVASARQTQDTALSRFTLSALLVNSYWYGSVAAGDTLCAVRAAADQAGVSGLVAPAACQSRLIAAFLTRAATRRGTAAEPPASGIDPLVQEALQADADIPEAPCGPAGGGVSCLEPVASQLQIRQDESAQLPTLPWEEPTEPPVEPTTPPEPPHAVTASDGDYIDRVAVSWDAVEDAVYYEVYRSTSSTLAGELLDSHVSDTVINDPSAIPGYLFWYSVRACNSAGCSNHSTPDSGYIARPVTTFTLSVNREGNGDGVVTSNPGGIDCGSTCSSEFARDTEVTLTANALGNSSFDGWGGACSGESSTCVVTMNQAQNVTVTFRQGESGEVRVNLTWSTAADLDLHVIDPCGNEIYFENFSATCQDSTGTLDVDANWPDPVPNPAENIFWASNAPRGSYQVNVCYFETRDVGTTAYEVFIKWGDSTQTLRGSITYNSCQQVADFRF